MTLSLTNVIQDMILNNIQEVLTVGRTSCAQIESSIQKIQKDLALTLTTLPKVKPIISYIPLEVTKLLSEMSRM